MTEAIRLLRTNNLGTLPQEQVRRLLLTLEQHPSIVEFEGCGDAVVKLQAAQQPATAAAPVPVPLAPDASNAAPRPGGSHGRKIFVTASLGVAVLLAVTLLLVWQFAPHNGNPKATVAVSTALEPSAQPVPGSESKTSEPKDTPLFEAKTAETKPSAPKPTTDVPKIAAKGEATDKAPSQKVVPATTAAAETPALAGGEEPPDMEVTGAGSTLLRDDKGGFRLTRIDGLSMVKLIGKASRVAIEEVNGLAIIHLGALVTPHIEFLNSINGNPQLVLNSPDGLVEFNGKVCGSATLTINAPNGRVIFHADDKGQAKVQGGAIIHIIAKSVDLAAGLDEGAKVHVTLTRGGSLHHGRLDGGSNLTYRKEKPDDPQPVVEGIADGPDHVVAE